MLPLKVDATWDPEASVWVATSNDVPGLVTEASTLKNLRRKLRDIVPELLAENAPERLGTTPIPIDLIAQSSFST